MSKGLSDNQWEILKWLDEHPASVGTVDRFREVIQASRPSIRRALYSLERRGLVKRISIGGGHYQRWVKVGDVVSQEKEEKRS